MLAFERKSLRDQINFSLPLLCQTQHDLDKIQVLHDKHVNILLELLLRSKFGRGDKNIAHAVFEFGVCLFIGEISPTAILRNQPCNVSFPSAIRYRL